MTTAIDSATETAPNWVSRTLSDNHRIIHIVSTCAYCCFAGMALYALSVSAPMGVVVKYAAAATIAFACFCYSSEKPAQEPSPGSSSTPPAELSKKKRRHNKTTTV